MGKINLIVSVMVMVFCTITMFFSAASLSETCDIVGDHDFICRSASVVGYPIRLAFKR